ncbi:DEAD-box ATP-dependent RNA helicase 5 [Zea mays]|uniref:DEAD-box ATP-dependent RNA helicase 5-like n=1 Tax=Zea mays TaxID=4577 RepID=UPI0004DEC25A|nr:DEAD-box ATP-dependent RNA helicase 5-like [Zea mays]XP_008666496.1 DEAD-box ATP-dependent RNA helicase 5 [Zea mays]|eukprot:XP_008657961.1 DEAD-box ATP-dependent RNA helicase 5-like [Zea mays]
MDFIHVLHKQISDVLSEAGAPCGIKSVCLYGGTKKEPQISALKSGVDIVIGTPGRMKDLIEMGVCCLNEVSFVVLDEADKMLDLGFEPEVRAILSQTSSGWDNVWQLHLSMLPKKRGLFARSSSFQGHQQRRAPDLARTSMNLAGE